jgi:hypothetical protein
LEAETLRKLKRLKIEIAGLYGLFAGLIAMGQLVGSNISTLSGLMAFTAAAALTTYYMVLTQP